MALINSDVIPAGVTTPYTIDQSLRFNDGDSPSLSRTPSSSSSTTTWTWSGWLKISSVYDHPYDFFGAYSDSTNFTLLELNTNGSIVLKERHSGTDVAFFVSDAFHRDPSSWYHIMFVWDSSNATASDRFRFYVNGERLSGSSVTNPSQNQASYVNTNIIHYLGRVNTSSWHYDGYMSEVNFIDGQALDPTSFGETGDYGEWKPIAYTGTYGTNGWKLNFSNASSLGEDSSGNGNNWTATNLATTDVVLDSPTNNFATLNPLWNPYEGSYSQGNLYWQPNANHSPSASTIPMESGKYYAEFRAISGSKLSFGVFSNLIKYRKVSGTNYIPGEHTTQDYTGDACVWYYNRIEHNASIQSYPFSSHILVSPNVYMIAFDSDSGKVWFGKEGVWYNNNNQSSTLDVNNPDVTMSVKQGDSFSFHATGENSDWKVNFGQDSSFSGSETSQGNTDGNGYGDFTYTPPSGFLALCTANLPDPAVIPSEHFNTVLYTGNGSSSHSITGVGFQPELNWIKNRSVSGWNVLSDVVRGVPNIIQINTNAESSTGFGYGKVSSLDSDGFTIDSGSNVNTNGNNYVAWNWKANGSGVSNTNGSITSTVSANQDAGFSIVGYTGTGANATIGHGLSQAPEMTIFKERTTTANWYTWHKSLGAGGEIYLNTTGQGYPSYSSNLTPTLPTSTLFYLGTGNDQNQSGSDFISYHFHSVDGFSKTGTYTGNGSTDGTFVYTGFRPAFVMVKRTNSSGSWYISDDTRDTTNPLLAGLYADSPSQEDTVSTSLYIDYVSNGFKLRGTYSGSNASGSTYIYLAFAENPFKYTNAR